MSDALNRLINERKNIRQNHVYGFVAKPIVLEDGSLNFYKWNCVVPGRENTPWAGGRYQIWMVFPPNYPNQPLKCIFIPTLFHPNISPHGLLDLQTLKEGSDWEPTTTIREILNTIQDIIYEPNMRATVNVLTSKLYRNDPATYMLRACEQAQKMSETY